MRSLLPALVLSWAFSNPGTEAIKNLADVPCGRPKEQPKPTFYVVGGQKGSINAYPHAVSLQSKGGQHICGGSLVHKSYVITAAHCVGDRATPDVELLVAGDQNVAVDDATREQRFSIDGKPFIHPEYDSTTGINDIAIVKLNQSVEWTDTVKPICLPNPGENLKENEGTLAGWGYTRYNDWINDHKMENGEWILKPERITKELHHVKLPIVDKAKCKSLLKNFIDAGTIVLTDKMLCAGEFDKDGCLLDSGSGLVTDSGNITLLGIMSNGKGCGGTRPGIYTDVSSFVDWIEGIINQKPRRKRDVDNVVEPQGKTAICDSATFSARFGKYIGSDCECDHCEKCENVQSQCQNEINDDSQLKKALHYLADHVTDILNVI